MCGEIRKEEEEDLESITLLGAWGGGERRLMGSVTHVRIGVTRKTPKVPLFS